MSDAITILQSIDDTLKKILTQLHVAPVQAPATAQGSIATAKEMSGQYGDPQIRFNPKAWPLTKGDFKGVPMSQCPAEFLLLYAEAKDFFGQQADERHEKANNGKPKGDYDRLDARRARGWAQRNQGKTPARPSAPGFDDDTDVSY